ncbi:hypothetical protein CWI45_03290, partial [Neisseria meningitidis]
SANKIVVVLVGRARRGVEKQGEPGGEATGTIRPAEKEEAPPFALNEEGHKTQRPGVSGEKPGGANRKKARHIANAAVYGR